MSATQRWRWLHGAGLVSVGALWACGAKDGTLLMGPNDAGGGTAPLDAAGSSSSGASDSGDTFTRSGGSGGDSGSGVFVCDPNAANYDIPGNGCDDDGNGKVDDVVICDNGALPPSSLAGVGTAADLLAAMGVCQAADATHWGIVSATYTNGHSQTGPGPMNFAQQHGTLGKFGNVIKPQEGSLLGVLSTGTATEIDNDLGPLFKGEKNGMQGPGNFLSGPNGGDVPAGFPKTTMGCPSLSTVIDDVIDVKLKIKVPANAKGFAFDFDFWSGEWPEYVCSQYNDSFIAYLTSKAFQNGAPGNMSFDTKGNPISVNNDFFGACTPHVPTECALPGNPTPASVCALGEARLVGTGFGQDKPEAAYCGNVASTAGGATNWLTSAAPVSPGETISLELIIWDTGDVNSDSTVLLDHWVWQPKESAVATPVTHPAPLPK
jgi:hypothetical protein